MKGRKKASRLFTVLCIASLVQLVFGILGFFLIRPFIESQIRSAFVVSEDSEIYPIWLRPPVHPIMKLTVFNVTNMDAWLEGEEEEMAVEEVGPFVYRETWTKENVEHNVQAGLVSYDLIRTFAYLPDRSTNEGSLDAIITVPNIPLFAAGTMMKDSDPITLMGFQAAIRALDTPMFKKVTVRELIWGYDDALTALSSVILPPEEVKIPGKFGLFAGKNGSSDGELEIFSGAQDMSKISQVHSFRGRTHFEAWRSESSCNRVRGGEGSLFPSPVTEQDQLEIFVPDLCRPLTLVFNESILINGDVPGLRFRPHPDLFNPDAPENECYCVGGQISAGTDPDFDFGFFGDEQEEEDEEDSPSCGHYGTFDVSPCKFGAPLVVSWPHFFGADSNATRGVKGLRPDEVKHGFSMDVQPTLGMGLSAHIRLQLNLKVQQIPNLEQFSRLPASLKPGQELLIPILWFDDTIDEPPPDLMVLLKDALKIGCEVANGLLFATAILLTLSWTLFFAYRGWKGTAAVSLDNLIINCSKDARDDDTQL